MATRTIMSLADFLKLPAYEPDGTHYELDEGELITLAPNVRRHGYLMGLVTTYLNIILDPAKFTVLCEDVGYILGDCEYRATLRGADVSVEAVPADNQDVPKSFQHYAPFVAIEIISESNTARDIQRKTAQYLAAGGQEVWLIYRETEETHVFRAGQSKPEIYPRRQSFLSCLGLQVNTDKFFSR